ncbi:MAG: DUF72 domain-containing protein [Betaproteobacteria bacterium]|nr:DUF72 domain-containing protein [Betaproteobacteria bacterium]
MPSNNQPGLFEDETPPLADDNSVPARKRGIEPAAVDATAADLAARLSSRLHLGTSSWSFPGWQGLVYAGEHSESSLSRNGLAAYSRHPLLRSVGIDRTFYAPIAEADYARYASQVPDGFRFLVKAPMAITSSYLRDDEGKFSDSPFYLDVEYATREFVQPCMAGLSGKAGPLVFQFPPQGRDVTRHPDPFINRLYRFLKALPAGPLYAVEVRDPELLTDRFFMCLKTTGARFCVASHARMPAPSRQIELANSVMGTGDFIARWSLHSGFKYEDAKSRYSPFNKLVDEDLDSRESLARACMLALNNGFDAYVIVNNKAEGSAPLSIGKLAQCMLDLA